MFPADLKVDDFTLSIVQEIQVQAPIAATFESLLEQIGPANERGEGDPMPMVIEPWPGGRWYRDLGNGNGHFWANVQAIKRPNLLEFCGPLFASSPFVSNVQYRLSEKDGGTLIVFRHTALGFLPEEQRKGVQGGWASMNERVKKAAEQRR
jgi:uncharacterized protein YndB with AHSA1/START domain